MMREGRRAAGVKIKESSIEVNNVRSGGASSMFVGLMEVAKDKTRRGSLSAAAIVLGATSLAIPRGELFAQQARPALDRQQVMPGRRWWCFNGGGCVRDFLPGRPRGAETGRQQCAQSRGRAARSGEHVGPCRRQPAAFCFTHSLRAHGSHPGGPIPGGSCWGTHNACEIARSRVEAEREGGQPPYDRISACEYPCAGPRRDPLIASGYAPTHETETYEAPPQRGAMGAAPRELGSHHHAPRRLRATPRRVTQHARLVVLALQA